MPKYKVTATMYTDLYIDIEADNAEEAIDKARERDGGEWLEDVCGYGLSGDFKIDNVFIYDDKGDYHEVSNEVDGHEYYLKYPMK